MRNVLNVTGGSCIEYSVIDWVPRADPERIHDAFLHWLTSPAMTRLLGLFGRELDGAGLTSLLASADAVTKDHFDLRKGKERTEAGAVAYLDGSTEAEVTDAVDDLIGSLYRRPERPAPDELGSFDHVLVLGGFLPGCLLRGELYRRLADEGLSTPALWGLGSRRAVRSDKPDEKGLAEALRLPVIEDELDAMAAALAYSTGRPFAPQPVIRQPSEVRELWSDETRATGLAAEPGPGRERANTADTYRFFLSLAQVQERDRILVITSAIHAPFQHAGALGHLGVPTGATITTVGAHLGTSRTPGVTNLWTTANWLQEVRSTITHMRQAYETLKAAHPGAGLD